MNKSPIAICTTSLIRNNEEKKVVFQTIEALSRLNVPVVITDGGSNENQKRKIKSFPNIIFQEVKGHTKQLVSSFNKGAAISDALFYLHTDKLDFAKNHVRNIIKHYSSLEKDTMLVIERDDASFNSYPEYQREVEDFLNFMIGDYLGKAADYYYGPKIIQSRVASYASQIHEDIKWGIEAYFYAIHHRLGLSTNYYKVDIKAPKEVLEIGLEHQKYRLEVVKWQIDGLLQGQMITI